MLEIAGDIWEVGKNLKRWVCIPTNGIVNNKGLAVMGAGLALQAVQKYPGCDRMLGDLLRAYGNFPYAIAAREDFTLWSFPTKKDYREDSDPGLIRVSAQHLHDRWLERQHHESLTVYLPQVGCGLGNLNWETVKTILQEELPENNFVTVTKPAHARA